MHLKMWSAKLAAILSSGRWVKIYSPSPCRPCTIICTGSRLGRHHGDVNDLTVPRCHPAYSYGWIQSCTDCLPNFEVTTLRILFWLRHLDGYTCVVECRTVALMERLARSMQPYPDSKVHGANMGPIWGLQDTGGPHVDPMNFAICVCMYNQSDWAIASKNYWFGAVYTVARHYRVVLQFHYSGIQCLMSWLLIKRSRNIINNTCVCLVM